MAAIDTKLGHLTPKEASHSQHIPYVCHIDPHTVLTEDGDCVQVIKLQGISFETVDDSYLNNLHDTRNVLLRNIADGQTALWSTIVRKKVTGYPGGEYNSMFSSQLDTEYKAKVFKKDLFSNDQYLAIVTRDIGDIKLVTASKKARRKFTKSLTNKELNKKRLKKINDLTAEVISTLGNYDPTHLRTYNHNGIVHSEVLEFFSLLVNGEHSRVPVARSDISKYIATCRTSFGVEVCELRRTTGTTYTAALGIKEYCSTTSPGMLDSLLTLPMEFVLTQSFTFSNKQKALENIVLHRDRLVATGDLSQSQVDELSEALDDLTANKIVAGEHHLVLTPSASSMSQLEDNLTLAKSRLGDAGLITAREDDALEASYWSQLPGNFSYRPRPATITSKNFSAFSPFHNFPTGQIDNNHWGDALILLRSTSGTPYYLNFHNKKSSEGYPPGNGVAIGPTGTGKTVAMGTFLSFAGKYKAQRVFFDKDKGGAIMVNALGGVYTAFEKGVPTGLNPLQMNPTPSNIEFMKEWVERIFVLSGGKMTPDRQNELSDAIQGVLALPLDERRLNNLIPFLDVTEESGLAVGLTRWCGTGDRAWVFDNDSDTLNLGSDCLGFDMTDVLDNDDLRTPIAMYIIHRIKELLDGRRAIVNFDEGWKYAKDPILGPQLEDFYRTIRKQNGVMIFGTNDVSDITKNELGKVFVQQSQWQIYFPNPLAKEVDYIEGLDLSRKEYEIIKTLPEESRCFLIKRGRNSVVVSLDLTGMTESINVLSGTTDTVNVLNQAIQSSSNKPEDWLPVFHQQLKKSA